MREPTSATTILAFDCAGASCAVALWRGGEVLARRGEPRLHGQAEVLLPMIEACLAEARLGYRDLGAIATTLGPGSFTGLRAGLAAARGLALATGLPAVGVTTFEASAHQAEPDERRGRAVMAAIDTRRDDLFVQAFDAALRPVGGPSVARATDAAAAAPPGALTLTGDAAPALARALAALGRDAIAARAAGAIDAAVVAAIAAARLATGATPAPLAPVYLRQPDVTPAPARRRG